MVKFLFTTCISVLTKKEIFNVDPLRERKLLLHKEQISRFNGLIAREGYTLIPLSLYLKEGKLRWL